MLWRGCWGPQGPDSNETSSEGFRVCSQTCLEMSGKVASFPHWLPSHVGWGLSLRVICSPTEQRRLWDRRWRHMVPLNSGESEIRRAASRSDRGQKMSYRNLAYSVQWHTYVWPANPFGTCKGLIVLYYIYVCIYIYIYIYIHTHTHTYMCVFIWWNERRKYG